MQLNSSNSELEELYNSLGRMCVRFQELEESLRHFVCSVMETDDIALGLILTSELSFRKFVNVALSLAHHKQSFSSQQSQLEELFCRIQKAEERRNQLVHSVWDEQPSDSGTFRRMKRALRKSTFSISSQNVHPDDIDKLSQELAFLSRTLVTFYSDRHLNLLLEDHETPG